MKGMILLVLAIKMRLQNNPFPVVNNTMIVSKFLLSFQWRYHFSGRITLRSFEHFYLSVYTYFVRASAKAIIPAFTTPLL